MTTATTLYDNPDEITSAIKREKDTLNLAVLREEGTLVIEETDGDSINAVTLSPQEARVLYEHLSRSDVRAALGF
jgi:hypothetical protein